MIEKFVSHINSMLRNEKQLRLVYKMLGNVGDMQRILM